MVGYVGEIRLFSGVFMPEDWHFCHGLLMPIGRYQPLFAVIGTTYGGDGRKDFALPDLRGRVAVHSGTGPGLSARKLGAFSGTEDVELSHLEMPAHTHTGKMESMTVVTDVYSVDDTGTASSPRGNLPANTANGYMYGDAKTSSGKKMAGDLVFLDKEETVSFQSLSAGADSNQHYNMQPFLALHYIICTKGEFPVRS
ncbi:MAG: tail fiber protein [Cytophagales bacterium]|nr:tail fiber protein [Cytophagales bacterium]